MKIKLFDSFILNEGGVSRQPWALSSEMKSKLCKEIENVLIELTDNGFVIDIDFFAKKVAEQNSILVSVNRSYGKEEFNTDEVKDNLEVLLNYIQENYDVKDYDYNIETKGNWPNNRNVTKEYPNNLEVIEIDIDLTI